MHEPLAARAAAKLYRRGYKRVYAIRGGLYDMQSCGFKIQESDGTIYYRDITGKVHKSGGKR